MEEEGGGDLTSQSSSRIAGKGLDTQSVGSGESLMAFQLDQVAICPPDKEEVLVRGKLHRGYMHPDSSDWCRSYDAL